MKVLGIRNSNAGIRYCIIEGDINGCKCLNLNNDNRILLPKGCNDIEFVKWYKSEIDLLIDKIQPDFIAVKHNENTRSDKYSSLKIVMFMDSIVTLEAAEKNVPFASYNYKQIGTNSSNVLNDAEQHFGKSDNYWKKEFADSLMVAYKIIQNGI